MTIRTQVKKFYWDHLRFSWTHRFITVFLGSCINLLAYIQHFYFPQQYIRQWKVDMIFGGYERESTILFKQIIKPGMTVLDIGAHIGYYTRLFSRLTGSLGKVYAFEADPDNFALLQKNTNSSHNVIIYQVALTDHIGSIDFYESEEKTGCHSTILGATAHQRKIIVQGIDLDTVCTREDISKVDIIKMDIEGGEPAAVRGMSKLLDRNPRIILITELSLSRLAAAGVTPLQYLRQLGEFGFQFFSIDSNGLKAFNLDNFSTDSLFTTSDFVNIFCQRN